MDTDPQATTYVIDDLTGMQKRIMDEIVDREEFKKYLKKTLREIRKIEQANLKTQEIIRAYVGDIREMFEDVRFISLQNSQLKAQVEQQQELLTVQQNELHGLRVYKEEHQKPGVLRDPSVKRPDPSR